MLIKQKCSPCFYVGYKYSFSQFLILGSGKTKTLGALRIVKNILKRKHLSECEKSEVHLLMSLGNPEFFLHRKTAGWSPFPSTPRVSRMYNIYRKTIAYVV